jgi:hypothetical protein
MSRMPRSLSTSSQVSLLYKGNILKKEKALFLSSIIVKYKEEILYNYKKEE